jgi:ATP-binding cassette subfamily F protein uup
VLVLDEPTNDLDLETLDLLEELLLGLQATLLVVSHDRAFLDNVVTSTLVLEGGGRVGEYVGGYSDWVRQRDAAKRDAGAPAAKPKARPAPTPPPRTGKKKRLSQQEARELAELPERIDAAERARDQLFGSLADPAVLRDGAAVAAARARLAALEADIAAWTARWEALEVAASEAQGA